MSNFQVVLLKKLSEELPPFKIFIPYISCAGHRALLPSAVQSMKAHWTKTLILSIEVVPHFVLFGQMLKLRSNHRQKGHLACYWLVSRFGCFPKRKRTACFRDDDPRLLKISSVQRLE